MSRMFKLLRQLAQEARDQPTVIVKTRHGYRAFGRYDITVSSGSCIVKPDTGQAEEFTDLRCAVMWCQFMTLLDIPRAVGVLTLDQELGRIINEIHYRQQKELQGRGSELNDNLLLELNYKLESVKQQINKYAAVAKYKQLKGSTSDETNRTKPQK